MRTIEHDGVVKSVDGEQVKVSIISESACASCHARGACSAADMEEKEIKVFTSRVFKPGDHVSVISTSYQGLKATWWAYVFPLVLVVLVLAITFNITGNENMSGALALLALVPYFVGIYLAQKRLQSKFTFSVKSKN